MHKQAPSLQVDRATQDRPRTLDCPDEVNSMRRRHFLILLGGAVALTPFAAGADQPAKVFRIGILANLPMTAGEGAVLWGAFIQGLRDLGYVEGRNFTIE